MRRHGLQRRVLPGCLLERDCLQHHHHRQLSRWLFRHHHPLLQRQVPVGGPRLLLRLRTSLLRLQRDPFPRQGWLSYGSHLPLLLCESLWYRGRLRSSSRSHPQAYERLHLWYSYRWRQLPYSHPGDQPGWLLFRGPHLRDYLYAS